MLQNQKLSESNTKYAQGGIAVVFDQHDSVESHIEDTLKAGDGLCDLKVVESVVKEGYDRLNELILWGAEFDKAEDGTYTLGREGGHSKNRIIHHKDITGFEIERALLKAIESNKNIELLEHFFVIDLITDHHIKNRKVSVGEENTCYGAYILNHKTDEIFRVSSKLTILAAGGVGNVYKNTTNPPIATGDGIGLAYRAKALISDMEFIQFHPTALYQEKRRKELFGF